MKRFSRILMVAMVAVALLFAFSPMATAETYNLTYSNFFPPTHIQSKLAESWCQEIEKRTDGRVKVNYFPGQTLTKAKQCYDGTIDGLSDIGFSVLAYTRGRFPVMAAVDLPLGYTSGQTATKIVNMVYQEFKPDEFKDVEVMYLHAHGPGLIHTKNKAVHKLEDMQGLKFRGHGTSAMVVKALGGTPVPKPMPETYEMLRKGVVDGAAYPFESNKGWKLGEVTEYVTAAFSAAYTTSFFVVMNKDKWNALPADIQKIITEINLEWADKHGEAWDSSDMIGIKYFLDQGGQIIGVDKKEQARWKEAVAPIISDYVAKAEKKGIKNAQEIIDYIINNLNKLQ